MTVYDYCAAKPKVKGHGMGGELYAMAKRAASEAVVAVCSELVGEGERLANFLSRGDVGAAGVPCNSPCSLVPCLRSILSTAASCS